MIRSPRAAPWALIPLALGAFLLFAPPHARAGATDEVIVPAVVGQSAEQAQAALTAAGLKVRVIQVASPVAGRITVQDPAAGMRVTQGALVTVRVGVRPSVRTKMPDVLGRSAEEALEMLTVAYDVHLRRIPSPAVHAGKVVRTEPRSGTDAWLRSKVVLYIGWNNGSSADASAGGASSTRDEPATPPPAVRTPQPVYVPPHQARPPTAEPPNVAPTGEPPNVAPVSGDEPPNVAPVAGDEPPNVAPHVGRRHASRPRGGTARGHAGATA